MLPDVTAVKWGLTLLLLLACNQLPKKPGKGGSPKLPKLPKNPGKGSSKDGKGSSKYGKGSPKLPKLPKVGDKQTLPDIKYFR
jgi:hypothetical protein